MYDMKIRNHKVGDYTGESDYKRRLNAYHQMQDWWHNLIVQWGLQTGRIKRFNPKETA